MVKQMLRPYLVVSKLVEQPTWGGEYIVATKGWQGRSALAGKKIGQSYELYDKSNLSLSLTSGEAAFYGELSDPKQVKVQSVIPNCLPIGKLISQDPEEILGKTHIASYGPKVHLLLKFTQALGNSFQLHVPDGLAVARWKPKPESWYYFEPGLITCGVRPDARWEDYQQAMSELDAHIQNEAATLRDGSQSYEKTKVAIDALVKRYNPWQYVNLLRVEKGTLLDLSPCGIHHSWEEDLATLPLGNVLYEIQLNVMDEEATIRSFDKGKMSKDGVLRSLQIGDYFIYADRSLQANNPQTHIRQATILEKTSTFTLERILETTYYTMDRLSFPLEGNTYSGVMDSFRHMFVKSGKVHLGAGETIIDVAQGHSAFIPAGCRQYEVTAGRGATEVLLSY